MDKYLFLYLKTGGGHLAPAKAIAETIKEKDSSDIKVLLHDGLEQAKPIVRMILEDGYKYSINNALWAFELLYAIHKLKPFSEMTTDVITHFIKPGIKNKILREMPDKIIVFHFWLIKPVNEILEEYKLKIPVIIVVTDPFTAPSLWFLEDNQRYIVFSETLKEKCIEMGMKSENIQVFPFVLDIKYSTRASKAEQLRIRKRFGFREESQIILIMGGGDGMPRGKKILRNILSANINTEIAVICGRNQKLLKDLNSLKLKYDLDNVKIFGFIDFVYSLIQISEIVITKGGPSTCMEILMSGKVPVMNNYIWEQEKGNIEYVCNGGFGIFEKDPGKIPGVVNRLLTDDEYYLCLSRNITNASIKNGVTEVSDYIMNYQ